jgi:predicted amidohydrolase
MTTCEERDAHLAMSAAKVSTQLQNAGADLVVLPELSSIDYSRETFANLNELAEPLDGPSFECWRTVAQDHQTHVAYSFARKGEQGAYICLAVVNSDGELVGHYDKLHLAQYGASMEKEYFRAGDHLFTFELKGMKFAPIICYDIRIPELSRALVLDHGADVILHCGAYYRDTSFATWHDFTTTRALENQIFFLSLNRAGLHYGNSRFCYPWMDEDHTPIQFAEHSEEFRIIDLDPNEISQARETYSFLKDRLADYNI